VLKERPYYNIWYITCVKWMIREWKLYCNFFLLIPRTPILSVQICFQNELVYYKSVYKNLMRVDKAKGRYEWCIAIKFTVKKWIGHYMFHYRQRRAYSLQQLLADTKTWTRYWLARLPPHHHHSHIHATKIHLRSSMKSLSFWRALRHGTIRLL
jgi:hypothetical protein